MNVVMGRLVSVRALAAASVAVVAFGVMPALAQDGLVVNGRLMSASRLGDDLGPANPLAAGRRIGGGRYSLWGGRIFDVRTGQGVDLPGLTTVLAVDPVRPRVFVRQPGSAFAGIAVVDAATGALSPFTLVGAAQAPTEAHVSLAASANRLFVDVADTLFARPNDPLTHDVRAYDGATGQAIAGGFTFQGPPTMSWMVTPDGETAFIAENSALTIVDLATGTRTTVAQPATGLTWDDLNERMIVSLGQSVGVVTRQGVLLGTAGMGDCHAVAVSPHTGRLYVRRGLQSTAVSIEDVRVFDSRTYALLGSASLPFRGDCDITVLSAPGPPRGLRASVSGRDVALSWHNVGAASHFVLDAGFAPGRSDLSIPLGPDSHVSFAGVPSGTYYLRLRGGNEFGGGRPSQEVTLVVP